MMINNNEASGTSRLNLDQTNLSQTSGTSRAGEAGSVQSTSGGASAVSDSISLSNSPDLVQQALNAGADARAERVQQLKALVQSNQYLPSAEEVSQALISSHIAGE